MERKVQKNTQLSFGGRQKVQVTKFAFDDFIFVVGNLLRTRLAQSLSSQYFAAVPTPNIAELVPSGFFLSTAMVFAVVRTHFSRKTPACLVDRTAINKQQFNYNNEHILCA